MKRFSTLLTIREVQIRATMRYHYISLKIAKIKKNIATPNDGVDVGGPTSLLTSWQNLNSDCPGSLLP